MYIPLALSFFFTYTHAPGNLSDKIYARGRLMCVLLECVKSRRFEGKMFTLLRLGEEWEGLKRARGGGRGEGGRYGAGGGGLAAAAVLWPLSLGWTASHLAAVTTSARGRRNCLSVLPILLAAGPEIELHSNETCGRQTGTQAAHSRTELPPLWPRPQGRVLRRRFRSDLKN